MSQLRTKYEEIVDVSKIATRGEDEQPSDIAYKASAENLKPSMDDGKKVLLLTIDMQNDFMPGIGSLGVPGAKEDVQRLTRFIYNNMGHITQIMCSLDTHHLAQIFHPCWWIDEHGDHPTPFTIISYDDVKNGVWKPVYGNPKRSVEYVKALEAGGKQQLCIWPYHCLKGTNGAALENQFARMVYFHEAARASQARLIVKGEDIYSEMYGIIKAEYDPNGFVNTPVLNAIEDFDEIYVAGEAASHCLPASVEQILEHYSNRPEVLARIFILEDCTSPVATFEQYAKDKFESFKQQYGIQVVKSTDVVLA
ncbi:hypothetical protein FWF48_00350 [Candidatus Saccharibacteria bacterium]|nr:hypothetical protein [Candidatus Saccharibacteria bacterium]